ncbi:O-antigen ligase family protein [uncultured Nitratireductor sp.]|uniref:O-antigen ligase family protein n=1 Tax=uncultured Nitratireductor sp. TaxID=520953 RepID=UPI0025E8D7D6|nr:O-antigen ligase family protein [uncultured Nitratireductor sp.]
MNYRTVNRLFTLATFAMPPVVGSATSVAWHGGALWCVFEVLSGRRRLSPDTAMRWVSLLMLVYVLSNVVAFLVNEPSLEMTYKLLPLATFLLFPFSYSIWTIAKKEEIAQAALVGAAIASFGGLVFALVQYKYLGLRAEGGAGNALVFADVVCLAGLTCLAGALIFDSKRSFALLVAFAAAFGAVMLSGSRSVWGVMIVLTLAQFFIFRTRVLTLLRGHILVLVGIAIVVVVLTSGLIVSRFEALWSNMDKLTEAGDYNTSVGLRVALWKTGAQLFAESPIFGHGMQNSSTLIKELLQRDFGLEVGFTHFHNGFLTIFVEAGIVAGCAIIAMFALISVIAVRSLANREDPLARLGGALLLMLAVVYAGGGSVNLIFGHDILDTVFMVFLIVGLFLAQGSSRLSETELSG